MAQAPVQPRSSARAAISGISLLMLVAIAVQASAGVLTPAVQVRQHLPMVRLIAEAVTRRVERQVRRQDERPAICRASVVTSIKPEPVRRASLAGVGPGPTRPMVQYIDLPPPVPVA